MDFINELLKYRNSDKIAVVFGNEKTTYNTLINNALRFAYYLSETGINSVIIKTARSTNAVTAALGTLFSGGIFAFLSENSTSENIKNAADDLHAGTTLDDDINFGEMTEAPDDFIPKKRALSAPICAVFTSGSTGMPKGALLTYRGLCETVEWQTEYMKLPENSHTGSYAEFSFIASFWEIWFPLASGFTLHIANKSERLDTKLLTQFIDSNNLLYIFLPSDVAQIFSSVYPGGALRFLRVAGGRLVSCGNPVGYEILYSLGMSENSGSVTFLSIKTAMNGDIPLGKPFGKTEIYLIDGEMAVSGPSLFAGYAADEGINDSVLVDNPNSAGREFYKKMYMSGDLAKINSDGNLVYIGRRDWIVKINNIKTNPNESERVILDLAGVDEAAVMTFFKEDGKAYLTCFYSGSIEPENFPKNLENILKPNEIPTHFIKLTKLPKNANGKIDRKELKMPELVINKVDFLSEEEKKIAAAFEKILGRNRGSVGANDGFISLGGNSLDLMRLQAELMINACLDFRYSDLFEAQTPRKIALLTDKIKKFESTKLIKNSPYPLTAPERQMWLLWRTGQDNGRYTVKIRMDFDGEIDREKAENALNKLSEIHPILCSHFAFHCNELFHYYSDETIRFSNEVPLIFDLTKSPLFSAVIDGNSLIFTAHHIIADAAAMRVLAEDFWALYDGEKPQNAIQFHDLEIAENSFITEADALYWERELSGVNFANLPVETIPGETKETVIKFTHEEIEKLNIFAAENEVTPFIMFTAAAAKLIMLIEKSNTACVGIPLSGRDLPSTIRTVGMLVRTLPLVIFVDDNFEKSVVTVNEKFKNAFAHQNFPFDEMNEKYGARYDVMVNFSPFPKSLKGSLSPCIIRGRYETPAAKLVIDLREEETGFCAVFTYDSYTEKTAQNFADAFRAILLCEIPPDINFTEISSDNPKGGNYSNDLEEVWKEILGADSGKFYDVGGTSLKAIQIEEAMLYRGLYISAADILRFQEISQISKLISSADEIDWEAE
jgi:acyl-coenzyme A synthetase/AMP-(fatty) acid ligase